MISTPITALLMSPAGVLAAQWITLCSACSKCSSTEHTKGGHLLQIVLRKRMVWRMRLAGDISSTPLWPVHFGNT